MENESIQFNTDQAIEGLSGIGDVAELKAIIEKEQSQVAQIQEATPTKQATEPVATVTEPAVTEEDEITKTLFGNVVNDGNEIEVTDLKGLAEAINKEGIFQLKDETELPKFLESYQELTKKVSEFEVVEKKYQLYENLFEQMPDYLYEAIYAVSINEDPLEKLKQRIIEPFDYSIPFEKQDIVKLVNHYYPNQFTQDEFEEDDNKALKIAKEEVKKKFADESKNYKPVKSQIKEQSQLQEKAIKESAIKVMAKLESSGDIPSTYKKEVSKILNSGYNSILTLFVNEKGEWKEDSAEKINFLLHGKDMLNKAREIIKKQMANKNNETHVALGQDRPNVKSGTTVSLDMKALDEQAKKEASKLFQ